MVPQNTQTANGISPLRDGSVGPRGLRGAGPDKVCVWMPDYTVIAVAVAVAVVFEACGLSHRFHVRTEVQRYLIATGV